MKINITYSKNREFTKVKSCLKNAKFYITNNYKVLLPSGVNLLEEIDDVLLRKLVEKEFEQNIRNYEDMEKKITAEWNEKEKPLNAFFESLPFKKPEKLNIVLSNYGSGGSYYLPNKLLVTLNNKHYSPLETITHETIHLILEKPIIKKQKLSHFEKESLVDYFFTIEPLCSIFPNYKMPQNYKKPNKKLLSFK